MTWFWIVYLSGVPLTFAGELWHSRRSREPWSVAVPASLILAALWFIFEPVATWNRIRAHRRPGPIAWSPALANAGCEITRQVVEAPRIVPRPHLNPVVPREG